MSLLLILNEKIFLIKNLTNVYAKLYTFRKNGTDSELGTHHTYYSAHLRVQSTAGCLDLRVNLAESEAVKWHKNSTVL